MDGFITINQGLFGQQVMNVLACTNLLDDVTWRQDVANDFRGALGGASIVDRVPEWTFTHVTFSYISGATISFSVDVAPVAGDLSGSAASDGLPPTNALLVSTQYAGTTPNRGRIYFAGLGEAAQENGVWNSPVVDRFRFLVEYWAGGFGPAGQESFLAIASRPTITNPAYTLNPVSAVIGRSIVATQRRRRIGSGS